MQNPLTNPETCAIIRVQIKEVITMDKLKQHIDWLLAQCQKDGKELKALLEACEKHAYLQHAHAVGSAFLNKSK